MPLSLIHIFNMSRVLSRFFSPQQFKDVRNDKIMQDLAYNVIDIKRCRDINWAILDFAALVCKSKNPLCTGCKLKSKCKYYNLLKSQNASDEVEESQISITYDAEIPVNPCLLYTSLSCIIASLSSTGAFLYFHFFL